MSVLYPRRTGRLHPGQRRRSVRHPVLRSARPDEPPHRSGRDRHRRFARRRHGLRRFLDQGLPVDPRVGHDAAARRDHGPGRPVPPAQDDDLQLLRARPADAAAVLPRPAQRRPQGRGVPGQHRDRRHLLLRRRGRVLRLRRRPLRHPDERLVLPGRRQRGLVEHRPRGRERQPRLQDPGQGRLLPGPAVRPPGRPARGHDREPDQHGLRHRARATTRSAAVRPRSTTSSTPCWPRPTR